MTVLPGPAGGPRMIDVGTHQLEVLDLPGSSEAASVVFLHEGLGSLDLWKGFPARVAAATGRRVIVYSRSGYGGSSMSQVPRTADYMHREALDVLPELLDLLHAERPVLVGHSDGASIALIHAGGSGRPVTALALLAPHVFVEEETLAGIRSARSAFEAGELRRRLGKYHADVDHTFWGWNDVWLSRQFAHWNIEEYLPAIGCPTLIIQGEDDPYGTVEQVDRICRGIAGSTERQLLTDCGHAPHLEHAQVTLAALSTWLSRVAG